jgi:SAM-dependent methyltransferase
LWGGVIRARYTLQQISPFLNKKSSIVDIGSGYGHVSLLLKEKGWEVTSVDVKNVSKLKPVNTILYDGRKLPFNDKSFEYSLLLTVLHHDKNPENLLQEALRVSNKMLIIEDVYKSLIGKYSLRFIDSLLNWDWFSNPHSNKKDSEWRNIFDKYNLKIVGEDHWFTFIGGFYPIRQILYLVEREI